MKAVQLIGYGDPVENLALHDVPEPPPPGPGEALVGVEHAPINFNDLMVPWGFSPEKPTLPATIGNEGAGVVLALGEGVASVALGDRVVLPFTEHRQCYQQRIVVPADKLVVVPRDADPQQAAMMAINPVAAALLLGEFVDLQAGDAVVFNAATSGLARWLIMLARERGLRTVGLVRKAADVEKVRGSGCDLVIVDDEPLDAAMKKLEGMRVRLGLDVLGGPPAGRLLQMLGTGGTLVNYGSVTHKPLELPGGPLGSKALHITGFFEGNPAMLPKVDPTLRRLVKYLGPNGPEQPVAAVYPLDQLKDAVAHAVAGGKVLLRFDGPTWT